MCSTSRMVPVFCAAGTAIARLMLGGNAAATATAPAARPAKRRNSRRSFDGVRFTLGGSVVRLADACGPLE